MIATQINEVDLVETYYDTFLTLDQKFITKVN